jgi:hypothetical protein
MLEQLTCATASVKQLVTTQLEAWAWGKRKENKENGQPGRGKMETVMALLLGWNETYHMWGNQ